MARREQPGAGSLLRLDFLISRGCSRGKDERRRLGGNGEEVRGYLRRLAPAKTQTVIADKRVQKQPSRLHPTSCAFSQVVFFCFFYY